MHKFFDDSFLINCGNPNGKEPDPSLTPIRISLPSPPKLNLIDGFGLPNEEQYWRRPVMPEKVVQLEKQVKRDLELRLKDNSKERVTAYKIVNKIWEEIENNSEYYKEEVLWIRKMWWHRIYGYWVFIKGKPTYICGWHFTYLTFWKIDGSFYPDYRDRDRRELLAWDYFYKTHETFKNLDKDGNAIPDHKGNFEIIWNAFKTFFGIAEPKGRRQGVSNKAQCVQFELISRKLSALGVIFSMTEDSANKLFKLITVRAFRHIPFFFLPTFDGFFDQSKEIFFNRPKNIIIGNDLQSRITHAESALGAEFDGTKIDFAVFDEPGKTSTCDVTYRWAIHKRAMALGPNIIGFSLHVSTTEEMDSGGGIHFQKLIYASNPYNRDEITGQTSSGLAIVFFPAYDGYEKCIDKWGFSVIDDPTPEQIKNGYTLKHGAKKILQSERDKLLNSKNPLDQIEYRRLVVKFPFTLDECFKLTTGSSSVNLEIIDKRCAELRKTKEPFVRGNFEWTNGFDSRVEWRPDPINGRFELSKVLPPNETNLKTLSYSVDEFGGTIKEIWMPTKGYRFTIGGDPFAYKGTKELAITTGSYQSDGGIAVLWERDFSIDPNDKNIYDWQSKLFVCVYRNRPMTEVYNEDLLKCAIYFGGMVYPETNIGDIWKYFKEHNYEGYLLFDVNPVTNKYNDKPGVYQVEKSKEDISRLWQNHIEYRGHKEKHISLLMEVAKVKSFEDFTKNDMYVAGGLALKGSESRARKALESLESVNCDFETMWKNM